jgi:predicted DNA-binding protein YlxM (UPF0122 family)
MKEFEKSLINKLKEKMNTRTIKEKLLRNIETSPPGHFEGLQSEIQSLPDERINELIEKVEDMLQDINMKLKLGNKNLKNWVIIQKMKKNLWNIFAIGILVIWVNN